MEYVIGVDGGSTKCLLEARDLQGKILAQVTGATTNHVVVGKQVAARRVSEMIGKLLQQFGGDKGNCRCIVVGAAGIDSPHDRLIVESFYDALYFHCPIFCVNDGTVALYAATAGVGILTISDDGSIVVGRNAQGKVTRSGGYSILISGEEGAGRWLSLMALRHMSRWVDECVPTTPLVQNMVEYFHGFDANKLAQCVSSLRRKNVDPELAELVFRSAEQQDEVALEILRRGAKELFEVAETVVKKLGFAQAESFSAGIWGSVFARSEYFTEEYKRLLLNQYPQAKVVRPKGDGAANAAWMALDYLDGKVDFISELI